MDRDEFYELVNPARMLICNQLHEAAHKKITELADMGIFVSTDDAGYNEWVKENSNGHC